VSEEVLGNAIKDFAKRDQVVIATKVHGVMGPGPNDRGLSRKHIFYSIENSLRRLNTDYVDLYQIHRWDNETPIEETMEALNDLVRSGKVRYIGASSMKAWQFSKAQYIAEKRGWAKFVAMQSHYNLINREDEREMNPLCADQGVGLIPWSPLARGLLTRLPSKDTSVHVVTPETETARSKSDDFSKRLYTNRADHEIIERVVEVGKKRGVAPATVALAWLLHKGVVSPIIGATKMNHLEDAVAAVHLSLSKEEIEYLEQLYLPHAYTV